MKFFECIGDGGRDVGSRFAVQPLCLDEPGTSGRIPERASEVPSGLGVVVGTPPTGNVTSCNPQPSEPDIVHDHIRLRQHQIVAVAAIGVRIRTRHLEHAGTTQRRETVGGSSWKCSCRASRRRFNAGADFSWKHKTPSTSAATR